MPRKYLHKKRSMRSSVRKQIEKVLAKRTEVKKQTITNTASVSTGGTIIPLLATIAQGNAHDQRVGNQVNLLSMYLRVQTALGDNGYNTTRVALIRTRQPTAVVAELFETTSFSVFGANYAGWNYQLVQNVYFDRLTTLNQLVAGQRATKYFKKYLKISDKINYQDSITGPPNENYYLVLVSDSSVIPHPSCNLVLTQRFTDA